MTPKNIADRIFYNWVFLKTCFVMKASEKNKDLAEGEIFANAAIAALRTDFI